MSQNIPSVPPQLPADQRRILEALRENIEIGEGLRGDPQLRKLTVKDLLTLGMIQLRDGFSLRDLSRAGAGGLSPAYVAPVQDMTPPPKPTGFSVNGAMTNMLLSWDVPASSNHAYTEIYRNSSDNLAASVLLGTAAWAAYADPVGPNETYYYWIRFVSTADVIGPFNDTLGTQGVTGLVMSEHLAELAVTASKLASASIDWTKLGSGLVPTQTVDTLPALPDAQYPPGKAVVLLTTDGKLYRNVADAWTAAVPTLDLTGTISQVQIALGAIDETRIAANAVTTAKIAADAITAGQLADGAVGAEHIAALAVTSAKVAANAITTAKIAADAVTAGQLADSAVGAEHIGALAVTAGKLANAAVATANIQTNAITSTLITDGAVSTAKIAANAITANEISAGAVTAGKIAANAVTATEIAAGTITAAEIAAGAITATEIAADAITSAKIQTGAVTATEIAAGTITAAEIAAGAITATEIAADAITSAKIVAGAVTATEIAADAITTAKIAAGAITATEIGAGAITAGKIAANAVTATEIAAGAITATELAAGAVIAGKIAANAVTAAEIAAGTITATEIASSAITADKISTGTITAAQMTAGTITAASGIIADAAIGNAAIANGAIGTAHIENAAVTSAKIGSLNADKINAGTINAAISMNALTFNGGSMNIGAGGVFTVDTLGNTVAKSITIKDDAGNTILSSGAGVPYNFLSGKPTSLNDINTSESTKLNGIAAGADKTSDNVAASVTGQTAFATLSQINAGNISTYIAGAAIGHAQIGTAAIKNAAIDAAAVTTLKIGEDQVTLGKSAYTAGSTTSTTLVTFTMDNTGQPVYIVGGASLAASTVYDSGTDTFHAVTQSIGLYVDGDLKSTMVLAQAYDTNLGTGESLVATGTCIFSFTPTAATHTYTLSRTAGQAAESRSLFVLETKR